MRKKTFMIPFNSSEFVRVDVLTDKNYGICDVSVVKRSEFLNKFKGQPLHSEIVRSRISLYLYDCLNK